MARGWEGLRGVAVALLRGVECLACGRESAPAACISSSARSPSPGVTSTARMRVGEDGDVEALAARVERGGAHAVVGREAADDEIGTPRARRSASRLRARPSSPSNAE